MLASLTTPIGRVFQPLLDFFGSVLAFFYSIIPNYPIDVALLTIVIMAALTPLTVKSTKNMAAMQALGPEMKKLQQKYKGAENRAQMNEEVMKLYKEHNVNPASGCLPMLLQMPFFIVLYSVIRGITNTVTTPAHTTTVNGVKVFHPAVVVAVPRYIPVGSKMYHGHRGCSRPVDLLRDGLLPKAAVPSQQSLRGHPLPAVGGGGGRTSVPADVPAQCPKSAGGAGQSSGGHASEIHATNLWVHLPKCGRYSERLFHRVERHPHPDPGDPLPEGPGSRPRPGPAARAGTKKGPAADRSERALPKPKATGGNGRGQKAATNGTGGAKAGGTTGAKDSGKGGTTAQTGRSRRESANGANGTRPTGTDQRQPEGGDQQQRIDRTSGPGNGTGSARVGPGPTVPTGPDRTPSRRRRLRRAQGAPPLQGQAREKGPIGSGVGGSQRKVARQRPRRSCSICWAWPRTMPSSSSSSEPKAGLFGRLRGEARVQARVRPVAPPPKRGRRQKSGRSEGTVSAPATVAAPGQGGRARTTEWWRRQSGGSPSDRRGVRPTRTARSPGRVERCRRCPPVEPFQSPTGRSRGGGGSERRAVANVQGKQDSGRKSGESEGSWKSH